MKQVPGEIPMIIQAKSGDVAWVATARNYRSIVVMLTLVVVSV